MAQPRWTMIVVHMVLVGLLILIVLSMVAMDLQNTSMQINQHDFHNFSRMFLKEQNVMGSIVPVGEPTLDFKTNVIENFTQIIWPIKTTIKYGIANGFIMIVNASSENEANSIFVAASQHRATSNLWDINGALDGYVGELIAEIMEEVHVVEEAQDAIVEVMKKCNYDDNLGEFPIKLY